MSLDHQESQQGFLSKIPMRILLPGVVLAVFFVVGAIGECLSGRSNTRSRTGISPIGSARDVSPRIPNYRTIGSIFGISPNPHITFIETEVCMLFLDKISEAATREEKTGNVIVTVIFVPPEKNPPDDIGPSFSLDAVSGEIEYQHVKKVYSPDGGRMLRAELHTKLRGSDEIFVSPIEIPR